jgi:hypothetical protein
MKKSFSQSHRKKMISFWGIDNFQQQNKLQVINIALVVNKEKGIDSQYRQKKRFKKYIYLISKIFKK